jgi:4-azaleucine resistance transporter AzlC
LKRPALLQFLAGSRDELAILLGVIPFGMIYGALALQAGLSPAEAQSMSWVVFAGSAQFMMVQLFSAGAPGMVIVLITVVMNLRHALYSASLAPYLSYVARPARTALAYLLTDEAYAVSISRFRRVDALEAHGHAPLHRHWYFFGAGLTLWTAWQISTAAGIFLGARIPTSWPLDFAIPLTFIALLVPDLKDRPSVVAALAAGITAALANGLPFKLGLLAAALVGIAAGMLASRPGIDAEKGFSEAHQ